MPRVLRRRRSRPRVTMKRRKPSGSSGSSDLQDAGKVSIDWFRQQNTSHHHTNEYENDALVLRRGETFDIELTFQDISFSKIMKTVLKFSIEPKPAKLYNTSKRCDIKSNIDSSKWEMKIVTQNQSKVQIVLRINIPVDTAIGRYSVDVVVPGTSLAQNTINQSEVIILFNPWNKDDDVYLDKEELRNEYVLNETGIVYQGSSGRGEWGIYSKHWNYGQFENEILDCVLRLLEKDTRAEKYPIKSLAHRNSPVWVSRILSAMLNSQDDDGVIEGNWSGDYAGGVSPSSWNGSVEILQQYYSTEKPVKYGQCWVFSGVMTTALRALGIPARSITNFDSAHDTDETMTIDAIYDEDGDRVEDLCNDSIWNFHVWNEIWTKRNDLPDNTYDGWQAVDSTPQELSSGLYQMGPAPLKAIKEGEIYAGHDTGFVFSEVNADDVKWITKTDEFGDIIFQKAGSQRTSNIGQLISTKRVGDNDREDITHLYKYPEGTKDERKAFETAYSYGKGPQKFPGLLNVEEEGKDLTIDLSTEPNDNIVNGDPFDLVIDVKNTSKRKLTVDLTGVISAIQYTGEVKTLVKRKKIEGIKIDPGKSKIQEIHVDAEEYVDKLTDLNCLKFVVVAKVSETGKQYVDDSKIQLHNKDSIEIKFLKSPKVHQRSQIAVTFTNPLPIHLSNVIFSIEGPGLTRPRKKSFKRLGIGKEKTVKFSIKPRKFGKRTLLVDIDSTQAKDFKSFQYVTVLEA